MNKTRILILVTTFLIGLIRLPDWVYNNFWNIGFWKIFPFDFKYQYLIILYSIFLTVCVELFIRFIKKFA